MIVVTGDIGAAAIALVVVQVDDHLLRPAGLGRIELADRSRVGHSRIQDELGPVALALQAHGERCGLARQKCNARIFTTAILMNHVEVSECRSVVQHNFTHLHRSDRSLRGHLDFAKLDHVPPL